VRNREHLGTLANKHYLSHQICIPVLRNALGGNEEGIRILRCIRAYVELDLLASFDTHTEETIELGRKVAKRFVKYANVSNVLCARHY